MESSAYLDMRLRRFLLWFFGLSVIIIVWKLSVIETDVEKLQFLKETIFLNKEHLQLTQKQMQLILQLRQEKVAAAVPTIYAITPTYYRLVQKAELTRISQTLALVQNVHWIVIEDAEEKTDLVRNLLIDCDVQYTHLTAKTPPFEKLEDKDPKWKKHRGVEQRNAGLKWLRDNFTPQDTGVVYFMDDDNTYNVKLFREMARIQRVGVWPVGLVGGLNAEKPNVDPVTGKVTGWTSGWRPNRPFAIDMAGFAINLTLVVSNRDANFHYAMEHGYQESEFLAFFTKMEELEPLAENCTQVYVWHTRTEKPTVSGYVKGLEVIKGLCDALNLKPAHECGFRHIRFCQDAASQLESSISTSPLIQYGMTDLSTR